MKRKPKKEEKPNPWISVNVELPKVVPGDGCSEEVLARSPRFEQLATWDGRLWRSWDGTVLHGVEEWTTEGVAKW